MIANVATKYTWTVLEVLAKTYTQYIYIVGDELPEVITKGEEGYSVKVNPEERTNHGYNLEDKRHS